MTDKTFLGGAALDVAIDAETHVDFVNRHNTIHRFHRSMAFLARNTSPNMGFVYKLDKIGQRINSIPSNLEGWLMVIGPRPRNRLNSSKQSAAMASDTSLNRGRS